MPNYEVVDADQLDADMTTVADAIRAKAGTAEKLAFPEGMAAAIPGVYAAGEAAEAARCAAKHYVAVIEGNGETSISFHVPFEPDFLVVMCYNPRAWGGGGGTLVGQFVYDIRAFGMVSAQAVVYQSDGGKSQLMTPSSVLSRYSRAEDGTITLENVGSTTGSFAAGMGYIVTAGKYTDRTDKELITEFVRSLGGSGSVSINQAKVDTAFTSEEWAALIAEKPDWTFSMV